MKRKVYSSALERYFISVTKVFGQPDGWVEQPEIRINAREPYYGGCYELFDQPVVSSLPLVAGTSCVCRVLWIFFVGSSLANPTVRREI